jgi:serine/threonine protein kinase
MRLQQITNSDLYTTGSLSRGTWPDAVAYREAIQTPHISLADPMLQGTGIQLDRRGLPVAYAGRFAIVFRLVGENNDLWAFRCFTTPGSAAGVTRKTRYNLIQKYVDAHRNIFVPFRYIDKGIRVGKSWYPALAMRWASGEPLGRWIEKNKDNPTALRRLAGRLTDLLLYLEENGLAHGDWQHDNLLIAEDGNRITLVDYDGMFVPELAGHQSPELGHPNYQHPARTMDHFGVGLDRFSCLTIQTALLALAQDGSLWDKYSDGESLLFKREDFVNPIQSSLFQEIKAIAELGSDETLADAVFRLEDACGAGAMSSLLPVVHPVQHGLANDVKLYDEISIPLSVSEMKPSAQMAQRFGEVSVTSPLPQMNGTGQPWWIVPETVTQSNTSLAQHRNGTKQSSHTLPKDTYTFIERTMSAETLAKEVEHLTHWRLGGIAMALAVLFIIGVAISLRNPFLPVYFAWLFAYGSLGYEKWPRKVIHEELLAEIRKMEDLIAKRKREIAEKGGFMPSSTGATNVRDYVTEKLRHISINRVLTVNGIRASTLRLLRNAGIETALDLKKVSKIDRIPPHQITALNTWIKELESDAQHEYRKTVGFSRSVPGEVDNIRHVVAEFERHVTQLRRELEIFPDVSPRAYLRKLLNQPETPPSSSSPNSVP